jgi:hypothetical protein
MITLSILCIIWGIYSYFKIKKICDQKNIEFNPLEVENPFYFIGIVIGLSVIITSKIYICIKYLP